MKIIRNPRAYKIADGHYKKAMAAAKKKGEKLAKEIERFVIEYGKS